MRRPLGAVVDLGSCARTSANLRGQRWALVTIRSDAWLVRATPEGPRGVRVACQDARPVAYEVGGFVLLLAADACEAFTIPDEEVDARDDELLAQWLAAGRPVLLTTSRAPKRGARLDDRSRARPSPSAALCMLGGRANLRRLAAAAEAEEDP